MRSPASRFDRACREDLPVRISPNAWPEPPGRSMIEREITFPARCKPLPPGYRVVQLDSGHYVWMTDTAEGLISVDRWWVRRCAFAHAAKSAAKEGA